MPDIFLSYRRDDSAGYAGRLRDSLAERLGDASVFRDVDTLRAGEDFVDRIHETIASCRVLIAIIGRRWISATDRGGRRRLDQEGDFVRLEISAGLARGIPVVPLLVDGAAMPVREQLPVELHPLLRRHAITLDDEDWQTDVDRLVDALGLGRTRPRARWSRAALALTAAVILVALGLLLFQLGAGGRREAASSAEPPGARVPGPEPESDTREAAGPAETGLAVALPANADLWLGELVYRILEARLASRGATGSLTFTVRLENEDRYDANFWDRSFRLRTADEVLSPDSALNELVPGHSSKTGSVSFHIPADLEDATLEVIDHDETAGIPIRLKSTTLRPPRIATGRTGPSEPTVVWAAEAREVQLHEATVTFLRLEQRRFANKSRLTLGIRYTNEATRAVPVGSDGFRLLVSGESLAPAGVKGALGSVVGPGASGDGEVVFALPNEVREATVRMTLAGESVDIPVRSEATEASR